MTLQNRWSTYQYVANKTVNQSLLDNLNRLTDHGTRTQRVVKPKVNLPSNVSAHDDSYHHQSVDLRSNKAASVITNADEFYDAPSFVSSSVTASRPEAIMEREKKPATPVPPHLRAAQKPASSPVPPHLRKEDNTPSKTDVASQINNLSIGPKPKSTYPESSQAGIYTRMVAAQTSHPPPFYGTAPSTATSTTLAEPLKPLKSGAGAKSAANVASYPCSYDDCGRGFATPGALHDHKYEEHDGYCPKCKIDTENFETLIVHKKFEGNHIACQICGKDFKSESGRDRHELKDHKPNSNTKCAFCHMLFRGGASLLSHHLLNQCRDPRGGEKKIREYRALSALAYDKLDYDEESSRNAFSVNSDSTSRVDESEAGGVWLLDRDDDEWDQGQPVHSDVAAQYAGDSGAAYKAIKSNVKGEADWSKTLFPNAASTPAPLGYQPTPEDLIEFEPAQLPEYLATEGPRMRTDWDHARLPKDVNADIKCPFISCDMRFKTEGEAKKHLGEGWHTGTELRCPRCQKRFDIDRKAMKVVRMQKKGSNKVVITNEDAHSFKKVPAIVRLIAHMESSQSCGVRDSAKYGHMIHMYSGGFLRVMHDDLGRSFLIEADEPSPEPAAVLYDHPGGDEW